MSNGVVRGFIGEVELGLIHCMFGGLELRTPLTPDGVGRGEGAGDAAATGTTNCHYPANGDTTCDE